MDTTFDVIVVGAGVAGLSASYHLKRLGLSHIVFERGKIGESWRSQRWDSFKLNSIGKLNTLAGVQYKGANPGGFDTAPEYVASFEQYVSEHNLPIKENTKVVAVEKHDGTFHVTVSTNDVLTNYTARNVIIASGYASELKMPGFAKNISPKVKQLHAGEYRSPNQLPAGAVLVVGSAQSGVQVAEDIANAGRKCYLSTSMVARVPRWYRGRDIMEWLIDMKFFDVKAEEIADPVMLKMKPPQITGVGGSRYTISLQSLAKKGVVIVGKTDGADAENVFLQPNAAMHVKFADQFSKKVKEMIDGFIIKTQLASEPAQLDEADIPDENAACASSVTSLNFETDNISSIIWCVGFDGDFGYIKLPVFDAQGNLMHTDGLPSVSGLYFIGYPWLRGRRSVLLFGIKDDAEFVVENIYRNAIVHPQPIAV